MKYKNGKTMYTEDEVYFFLYFRMIYFSYDFKKI